jgi:hypothetical protein
VQVRQSPEVVEPAGLGECRDVARAQDRVFE